MQGTTELIRSSASARPCFGLGTIRRPAVLTCSPDHHRLFQRQTYCGSCRNGGLLGPQQTTFSQRTDSIANPRRRDPLAQHLHPRNPTPRGRANTKARKTIQVAPAPKTWHFGAWSLEFGGFLEFEVWNLEFPGACIIGAISYEYSAPQISEFPLPAAPLAFVRPPSLPLSPPK